MKVSPNNLPVPIQTLDRNQPDGLTPDNPAMSQDEGRQANGSGFPGLVAYQGKAVRSAAVGSPSTGLPQHQEFPQPGYRETVLKGEHKLAFAYPVSAGGTNPEIEIGDVEQQHPSGLDPELKIQQPVPSLLTLHGLPINSNKVLEPDSQPEEAWQVPAKTQREPFGDPLEKVGLEEPVPAEYNISLRTTVETIAEVDWQQDAGIGVLHSLVPDPSLAFSGTVVHSRDVAAAARNTAHPAPRNVTVPAGIHVPSNGHGIAAERTPQTLAGLAGVDKQSPVIGNKYHISQSGNVYEKAPDRLMPATPPGARPQTLAQSAAVQLNVSLPAPAMTGSASTTVGGAQVPIMTNVVPHEIAHAIVNASGDQSASATASRAISAFASSPIARPAKSIELQLVPRSLGVVDIKIVNNSGQMTVMMVTSTAEAETLLRSEIGQLQDAIRSLGTLIEDVKVTVQQQTAQENGPGRDGRNLDAQMMQFGEHGEANGSFRDEELSESNSDVNSTTAGTVFPDEDPDATQLRDGIYL